MCAYSAGMDLPQQVCGSQFFHNVSFKQGLIATSLSTQLAGPQPVSQLSCLAVGVLELDMVAPTTFYMGSKNWTWAIRFAQLTLCPC